MLMLCLGVALFAVVHLAHRIVPGLSGMMPETARKVLVALLLVGSVYLMAIGYPDASPDVLWEVAKPVRIAAVILMAFAFILFFGSHPGSALRAQMRHPQLTGFKLWAVLHLVVNGDVRSVILFGGLLAWAVVSVIVINRQTGKPPLPAASENVIVAWLAIPIGLAVWAALLLSHASLIGVSPLG